MLSFSRSTKIAFYEYTVGKSIYLSKKSLESNGHKVKDATKIEINRGIVQINPIGLTFDNFKQYKGIANFENWDAEDKFSKIAFDIDAKGGLDADELIDTFLKYINDHLCKVELYENVVIISDIRETKTSIHVIITNRKATMKMQSKWVKHHSEKFEEMFGEGTIDLAIYRNGENKYRTLHGKEKLDQNGLTDYKDYNKNFGILDYFMQYTTDDMKTFEFKTPEKSKKKIIEVADDYGFKSDDAKETLYFIKELLTKIIKESHADDYNECFKVGCLLARKYGNTPETLNVFMAFLERSDKYTDEFKDKKWEECVKSEETFGGKPFTEASIYRWAKNENLKEFEKLYSQNFQKVSRLSFTDVDIAKNAIELSKGKFLYTHRELGKNTEKSMFMFDDDLKIWKDIGESFKHWKEINHLFTDELKAYYIITNEEYNSKAPDMMAKIGNEIENAFGKESRINDYIKQFQKMSVSDTHTVFDTHKESRKWLNFKNGLLDLSKIKKIGNTYNYDEAFRERKKEDYITLYLDYDFDADFMNEEENRKLVKKVDGIFTDIHMNNQNKTFAYEWLAYCFTGDIKYKFFMNKVGYTASNGKTFEADVYQKVLPIHFCNFDSKTFDVKFPNRHKFFAKLRGPMRFISINEINYKNIEANALKDFTEGQTENVVLFSTTETLSHGAKLNITTNSDLKFDNFESGLLRRGIKMDYTTKFVNTQKKVDEAIENAEENVKLCNPNMIDYFDDENYKNAYLHLILPYVYNYFDDGLTVPDEYINAFEKMCVETDDFTDMLESSYILTKSKTDMVSKMDFMCSIEGYNKLNKTYIKWTDCVREFKKKGIEYDRLKMNKGDRGMILKMKRNPHNELGLSDDKIEPED